jgi:hypothetical protein
MSRLVNYLQPVDFQSFEIAESKIFLSGIIFFEFFFVKQIERNRTYELSSFLETKAYNLHKEKSTEFVK